VFLTSRDFYFPGHRFIYGTYEDVFLSIDWMHWLKGSMPWNRFGLIPLYHGYLNAYLMLPFFWFFGVSWTIIRLGPVVWGVGTLALGYLFLRKAFGRFEAMTFMLLCAVNPAFILGVRTGNDHQSTLLFFSTACLFGFYRWQATGRSRWLSFGVAMACLGMMTRLWFAWFIAGLVVGGAFFYFLILESSRRPSFLKTIAWSALPFALVGAFSEAVSRTIPIFYAHRDRSQRIGDLLDGFNGMVSGRYFMKYHFVSAQTGFDSFIPAAFWICFVAMGVWVAVKCIKKQYDAMGWMWSVLAAMFLCAWASPRELSHHFFIFYPMVFFVLAVMLGALFRLLRTPAMKGACVAVLGMLIVLDAIPGWTEYHRCLSVEGEMIPKLRRWVEDGERSDPVYLGMNHNMSLLSRKISGCLLHQNLIQMLERKDRPRRWVLVVSLVESRPKFSAEEYINILNQYGIRQISHEDISDTTGRPHFRCIVVEG